MWGCADNTASKWWAEGCRTLDDVRQKATGLTAMQQMGLRYYEDFTQRLPRAEVAEAVAIIRAAALDVLQVGVAAQCSDRVCRQRNEVTSCTCRRFCAARHDPCLLHATRDTAFSCSTCCKVLNMLLTVCLVLQGLTSKPREELDHLLHVRALGSFVRGKQNTGDIGKPGQLRINTPPGVAAIQPQHRCCKESIVSCMIVEARVYVQGAKHACQA